MECYLIIKDIITFILTAVGLVIAGAGLFIWKKQIKGKKIFEAAYDLNFTILELREAIKHVRHPAIWPSESLTAIQYAKNKYPDKTDDQIEKDSHAYVYEMRWDKIKEALVKVDSHLLAAEVLWGKEILDLVKPIRQKVVELNVALKKYFEPDLRTKDYMDDHDIIFGRLDSEEDDKFSKSITEHIAKIDEYLKKKIK